MVRTYMIAAACAAVVMVSPTAFAQGHSQREHSHRGRSYRCRRNPSSVIAEQRHRRPELDLGLYVRSWRWLTYSNTKSDPKALH